MAFKKLLLTASILTLGFAVNAQAQESISKDELNTQIRQFLLQNPEVVMQSLELYRLQQQQQAEAQAADKIKASMAYLTSEDSPSIGNPDGDVTVVEFFDYNCGYCKRALPDIQKVLDNDPNVRFVFKEMPILSPSSEMAARWALAAHEQGKYFEFHSALMNHRGQKDEASLTSIAQNLSLDVEQMKRDANSSKIENALAQVSAVTREIGIQGTPAFIINGELARGYLGPGGLERAIHEARQKG